MEEEVRVLEQQVHDQDSQSESEGSQSDCEDSQSDCELTSESRLDGKHIFVLFSQLYAHIFFKSHYGK